MSNQPSSFIDGILNEKNQEGVMVFTGTLKIEGVDYVGGSTEKTSTAGNVYHAFVGKDKDGNTVRASIFPRKEGYSDEDRAAKRPYFSGKLKYKNEDYDITGWLRERKDKSGEFISISQSRPRAA